MKQPDNMHASTMAIAAAALGRMTAYGQAADPKSYELWYKFTTGDGGLLCAAVNSRLDRNGTLNAKDVDELYNAHICPTDASAKADKCGRCRARRRALQ